MTALQSGSNIACIYCKYKELVPERGQDVRFYTYGCTSKFIIQWDDDFPHKGSPHASECSHSHASKCTHLRRGPKPILRNSCPVGVLPCWAVQYSNVAIAEMCIIYMMEGWSRWYRWFDDTRVGVTHERYLRRYKKQHVVSVLKEMGAAGLQHAQKLFTRNFSRAAN